MKQQEKIDNRLFDPHHQNKPRETEPAERGLKVRTSLRAGRACWFIPIGPMGDGCLMCDDGSQYC